MVKPIAEQPSLSASRTDPVTAWSLAEPREFGVVDLEDGGDRAGEAGGAGLDHAERARERVQARVDSEPPMIVRVVSGRVGCEAAGRPVLEALIHRQDDHAPGAAEAAAHQDAGEIGLGARIVALVPGENFFDPPRDSHGRILIEAGLRCRRL